MSALPVSVICTTWNRAALLEKVLLAYARQTVQEFEFIVADDGSTDETESVVQRARADVPFPVKYVRHENQGFRKAATVNLGVRVAETGYVLVTDCDSLPHADLLEQHTRHARPGRFVLGECLRLERAFTETLDLAAVRAGAYESARTAARQRDLDRLQRRAQWYTWIRQRRKPRMRGNNFSLFLEDFRRVNGYDEEFVGWGNEDGDLRERLKRAGVRPYPIVNRAVVYHMWHAPHQSKVTLANKAYAWQVHRRPVRCAVGLDREVAVTEEASSAYRA